MLVFVLIREFSRWYSLSPHNIVQHHDVSHISVAQLQWSQKSSLLSLAVTHPEVKKWTASTANIWLSAKKKSVLFLSMLCTCEVLNKTKYLIFTDLPYFCIKILKESIFMTISTNISLSMTASTIQSLSCDINLESDSSVRRHSGKVSNRISFSFYAIYIYFPLIQNGNWLITAWYCLTHYNLESRKDGACIFF